MLSRLSFSAPPGDAAECRAGGPGGENSCGLPSGYTCRITEETKVEGYRSPEYRTAGTEDTSAASAASGDTIRNTKDITCSLPATGGRGTILFTVAGAALIGLGLIGLIVLLRRK